jgi:hypothetical protein
MLWHKPGATVLDVHRQLSRTRGPDAGAWPPCWCVSGRAGGRPQPARPHFCYTARVSRRRQHDVLDDLAQRVFGGDAAALVCRLIERGHRRRGSTACRS